MTFASQSAYQRTNHRVAKRLRQHIFVPHNEFDDPEFISQRKINREIEGGIFGSICRIECTPCNGGYCLVLRTDTTDVCVRSRSGSCASTFKFSNLHSAGCILVNETIARCLKNVSYCITVDLLVREPQASPECSLQAATLSTSTSLIFLRTATRFTATEADEVVL